MNQTRSFLLMAWLAVAAMLWMAWNQAPPTAAPAAPKATTAAPGTAAIVASAPPIALPSATPGAALPMQTAAESGQGPAPAIITLQNDVLKLSVDLNGGRIVESKLLTYTAEKKPGSANIELLSRDPTQYFDAQTGFITVDAAQRQSELPAQFRTEDGRSSYSLPAGAQSLQVPLLWTDPATGLSVRNTLTLSRGSYVLAVNETVSNAGSQPQALYPFVQLQRVAPPPPAKHSGLTNPESLSFLGAAWYSLEDNKYDTAKFDKYGERSPLAKETTGGWIAMLQHHFVTAWVPDPKERQKFFLSTESIAGVPLYRIRSVAVPLQLAPGSTQSHAAKLWVGPKSEQKLEMLAPGLDRAVDYSSYTILALLAEGLFWVLSHLYQLIGNWGWSIIALVALLKLSMYWLSAKQFQSMAKMRAVQPRIEALKERYGDDKQQFQIAMMELYKKEKINPVGGCLPMLLPIPIFIALYDLLLESVELRHAPWMGWIQSLTDPDPYFILPILNLGVMFLTQKLTPTPGMDPMQKKMMQFMPLVFGVMMAFFPAGLVLYWVTNGVLGLLQQQYITRKHGEKPAGAIAK
jgi:YidC/Oxa1 family membrane protein insertase